VPFSFSKETALYLDLIEEVKKRKREREREKKKEERDTVLINIYIIRVKKKYLMCVIILQHSVYFGRGCRIY